MSCQDTDKVTSFFQLEEWLKKRLSNKIRQEIGTILKKRFSFFFFYEQIFWDNEHMPHTISGLGHRGLVPTCRELMVYEKRQTKRQLKTKMFNSKGEYED